MLKKNTADEILAAFKMFFDKRDESQLKYTTRDWVAEGAGLQGKSFRKPESVGCPSHSFWQMRDGLAGYLPRRPRSLLIAKGIKRDGLRLEYLHSPICYTFDSKLDTGVTENASSWNQTSSSPRSRAQSAGRTA